MRKYGFLTSILRSVGRSSDFAPTTFQSMKIVGIDGIPPDLYIFYHLTGELKSFSCCFSVSILKSVEYFFELEIVRSSLDPFRRLYKLFTVLRNRFYCASDGKVVGEVVCFQLQGTRVRKVFC